VAPTDFTVLITGETGTGKELIVEGLHRLSNRAKGPFVPVDCGSITPTLIESELFGHEKGSYTGAHQSQPGKMEMASGGTLFLDEISNLTLALQAKLLRALEERKIWRVGGIRPIDVDIRVVGAANEDLGAMVQKNLFRKDLYYRLSEFSISIPPLRDRPEDIIFLATRFLMSAKAELTKDILGFSQEAVELLLAFEWPGNVRELRNVIRQAALRCDKYILPENMTISPKKEKAASNTVQQITEIDCIAGNVSLKEVVRKTVADIEKQVITEVLIHARWNKAEAARILSVDYKTIHVKVKEYKISQP
jgi:two-component system nitrogen regulation response regulator GlnG